MPISNARRETVRLGAEPAADVLAAVSRAARDDPAGDLGRSLDSDERVVAVEGNRNDVVFVIAGDDGHRTERLRARDFLAQYAVDVAARTDGNEHDLVDAIHTASGEVEIEYAHRDEPTPPGHDEWEPPGHDEADT